MVPTPSPTTHALGARSLELDRAVIVLHDELIALPTTHEGSRHPYGPAVGLRCAPATEAIAYPVVARQRGDEPGGRRYAMIVRRDGPPEILDPRRDHPHLVTGEFGPAVDIGRRALGISTPAEPTPPVAMLDAIWADRALLTTLDADLGRPPGWAVLGALHPLAGWPISPAMLRDRRRSLPLPWSAFRRRARASDTAWPGLPPEVADWLDDGSFARWVLADLPCTRTLLGDLTELLDPETLASITVALG